MSYPTFAFTFVKRRFREFQAFRNEVHEQGGGRRTVQEVHAGGEFTVRGRIAFPNPGGEWSAFEAFWEARAGGFGSFLYKGQDRGHADQADLNLPAAAGQQDFDLSRRYVDTATLVVKVGGVTKELGVDYTLQNGSGGAYVLGTSPSCVVHFAAAPGAGADVDATYEFYYVVRFAGDDLPDSQDLVTGIPATDLLDRFVEVQLLETGPGFSLRQAPDSL